MKKGFTLAEILIVLTVIGVLTAILLPIAFNSAPDENVMKFKKANANLGRAIYELVNSDKYYQDGDLGTKADGSTLDCGNSDDLDYFCDTLADILSIKSKNCYQSSESCNNLLNVLASLITTEGDTLDDLKKNADSNCKSRQSTVGAEIITSDGVSWFRAYPYYTINSDSVNSTDSNGFTISKFFLCIDIDGIDEGEDPFGYSIRADGKIIPGARADEWLEKSIQRGDD